MWHHQSNIGLTGVVSPTCHHGIHEFLYLWTRRRRPPSCIVEILMEDDHTSGKERSCHVSEHGPRVFHEGEHPAAPCAICCAIGKFTFIKINPACSDVVDLALMARRTEAGKKAL